MVAPLDEDVRILKAWIDQGWRYFGIANAESF